MTNDIATYITFYLYHNNTSLTTQYLHYLRSEPTTIGVGKHYKTHNTLLTEGKIPAITLSEVKLLICYRMQWYEL